MQRSSTAVGLDIGGRTIQLLALAADRVAPRLLTALHTELDPYRAYSREELIEEIRRLLQAARVNGPLVLAIGGNVATVQLLSFPKVGENQLHRMVELEAQRLAGLSPEEMVHDYIALPTEKTSEQKVLVALCRASTIQEQLSLISDAGVEAEDVTLSTVALFNGFHFTGGTQTGQVTAFVEIGRDATHLAIEADGALQFVRSFPTGGNAFTVAVAESEQLPFEEAERWKIEQGEVPETENPPGRFGRRQTALHHCANHWLNELNTTLAFYFSTRGAAVHQVDRFLFCGGGAMLRGLAQFSEARLEKPVSLGLPLQKFSSLPHPAHLPAGVTAGELSDPRYAVALGLALQGLGLSAVRMSLLPSRVRAERMPPEEGKKWIRSGLLAASIAITATLWAGTDYFLHRQRLRDQKSSIQRTTQYVEAIKAERTKLGLNEQIMAPFLRIANRGPIYAETLRAVAQSKPTDDWISLVADAESYFYKRQENDLSVPRLPSESAAAPPFRGGPRGNVAAVVQQALGMEVPPLKTMIVEGYALSPSVASVKDYIKRLEAEALFRRVDTLPMDRRVADPQKDALWELYRMNRFTLELTLAEAATAKPAPSPRAATASETMTLAKGDE